MEAENQEIIIIQNSHVLQSRLMLLSGCLQACRYDGVDTHTHNRPIHVLRLADCMHLKSRISNEWVIWSMYTCSVKLLRLLRHKVIRTAEHFDDSQLLDCHA
jgi:hypothetical protein